MAPVSYKSNKSFANTLEATRCARARAEASKALIALLEAQDATAHERLTDAFLDVAIGLHVNVHGPHVTAPKLNAKSGRIYPFNPRQDKWAEADAKLRGAA